MEYRSEQINELATALAKAQAEMQTALLINDNPFFKSKYAGLAEIVKASRPALTRNGLSIVQYIRPGTNDFEALITTLLHSSGQWIESAINIKPLKQDVQSFGSYISYLRRYGYAALVGVITGDEYDDGEIAMQETRNPNFRIQNESSDAKITKEQIEELNYELAGWSELSKDILKKMNLDSFADLKKSLFLATMKRIRELKVAELSIRKPTE